MATRCIFATFEYRKIHGETVVFNAIRPQIQSRESATVFRLLLFLFFVFHFFTFYLLSISDLSFKMAEIDQVNASIGTGCTRMHRARSTSESVPADLIHRIFLCIHLDLKTNTILYPGKGFDFYSFNGTSRGTATQSLPIRRPARRARLRLCVMLI